MFGNPIGSGLTFTKVIGGISKTLSIANQVIPLYREAKPMINNAKTILSVLKGMNTSSATPKSKPTKKEEQPKANSSSKKILTSNSGPNFFL